MQEKKHLPSLDTPSKLSRRLVPPVSESIARQNPPPEEAPAVLASMNLPDDIGKPPDPWHYDSVRLLRELDRIRVLVLQVPHTAESHGPTQTALDAIWRLQGDLRYLLRLHSEGQASFRRKHALTAPQSVSAAPSGGKVAQPSRPREARRRA